MNIPIVLIHGLGERPITLKPLELYLKYVCGFKRVYRIKYNVSNVDFEEALELASNDIQKYVDKNETINVIGQSMGGVIANKLYTLGWEVNCAIYIGSPLNGATLVRKFNTYIPKCMYKKAYDYLLKCDDAVAPPHKYHTITMGWGTSDFDRCVMKSDAVIEDDHNTHLWFADHDSLIYDWRIWNKCYDVLKN